MKQIFDMGNCLTPTIPLLVIGGEDFDEEGGFKIKIKLLVDNFECWVLTSDTMETIDGKERSKYIFLRFSSSRIC